MNTKTVISSTGDFFSLALAEDIDGKPVERTKEEYPYSYDMFVTYRREPESHKGAHVVYSDRLWQWDSKGFDKAMKGAGLSGQTFHGAGPKVVEDFLRRYYEDNGLILEAIGEGCNFGNGYPYWVFWFRTSKEG